MSIWCGGCWCRNRRHRRQATDDLRRVAGDDGERRHITGHHGTGTDDGTAVQRDSLEDHGVGADPDVVFEAYGGGACLIDGPVILPPAIRVEGMHVGVVNLHARSGATMVTDSELTCDNDHVVRSEAHVVADGQTSPPTQSETNQQNGIGVEL